MQRPVHERLSVPAWVWQRDELRTVLSRRDVGGLFRLLQRYVGASQSRLAIATGILQGRISEIIKGTRTVSALEVFERIADGLSMPDEARILLGLAPLHPVGLEHLGPVGRAEIIAVYRSQQDAAKDIQAAARETREIDILAVRALGIVGMNHSLLRSVLAGSRPPQVLRAMLMDPDSDAARRRACEIDESLESFSSGVSLAVARLRELAECTSTVVEIYLYDTLPIWRVIALDETLFVSTFGPGIEGHTSAMYRISTTAYGGSLHGGFRRFIGEVRRTARRVR